MITQDNWNNISKYLKDKLQFVEDYNSCTRGFVKIYYHNNNIWIKHTFNRNGITIQEFDIINWINYFDKI